MGFHRLAFGGEPASSMGAAPAAELAAVTERLRGERWGTGERGGGRRPWRKGEEAGERGDKRRGDEERGLRKAILGLSAGGGPRGATAAAAAERRAWRVKSCPAQGTRSSNKCKGLFFRMQ